MHPPDHQKLRTPEAAKRLGVTPSTMAKWRVYGCGPSYAVLGVRGPVVYDPADLDAWAASKKRTSTSDVGRAA